MYRTKPTSTASWGFSDGKQTGWEPARRGDFARLATANHGRPRCWRRSLAIATVVSRGSLPRDREPGRDQQRKPAAGDPTDCGLTVREVPEMGKNVFTWC